MVWSLTQRERLAIEKSTLEKYFLLGVTWIDPQHETKVEVLLKSNSDKEYKLRVYIPTDFPNSCPALVVVSPPELFLMDGLRLPEISDSFHTLEDTDGFHRICHFYPPDWTPDITLYQVFMKGRLWIEAYEAHFDTGEDMDVFLGEQKYTVASEEPFYESDDSINDTLPDFDSDGCLDYWRREPLADQPPAPPVTYMTSPFPHLSDQTLPTTVRVLQSMPEMPTLFQPRLPDEALPIGFLLDPSQNSELPAGMHRPPIENKDSPSSQLSQLPFSPVEHQSPERHGISPNNNNNSSNNNNNNNKAPLLSSPSSNYASPPQRSQQPLDSTVNSSPLPCGLENSSVISHSPNDPNNESQAQTSSSNNNAPSRSYRPTGGVDVFGAFHEEMMRRNSASRARPTLVPPPVKPKPKRPR
ncbi:Hypothetical predicted protein [Paramuricea clavata]|uniref:Uncharacterized protein n=1 Tax=Paramuricea clavata TaxID=317549 RepID=A0A6S7GYP7_PARCT|nr:Hypothetical predicted protein [Paramuricea clavata]